MNSSAFDRPPADHRPVRIRFITVCQQMLALAVVATVLTPAARTVSLEIRTAGPDEGTNSGGTNSASARYTGGTAQVPTKDVDAELDEHALTDARNGDRVTGQARARQVAGGERITSEPLSSEGYAVVGVTWDPGERVAEDGIDVRVRTRTDGTWSDWSEVPYHDEHAPDPDSAEGGGNRPGTEPILVGTVDDVQVRADTTDSAPADLTAVVITPGEAEKTVKQSPRINTAAATSDADTSVVTTEGETTEGETADEGELDLMAGNATPKPRIFSRRQWGANEEWRDRGSLSYYEVHGGFVHHTVTSNSYQRSDVPGIIRSIYSYHTRSRGWSDIGYNFLVDRFGRIWEGRAGGVARPVVGAHTLGYNAHSFAASAIGNFETTRPTKAMLRAFGKLFGWKLSLHGVKAGAKNRRIAGDRFHAISGHRDAGQTACPGRYLYDRLGAIRYSAKQHQRGWAGRELESDLGGAGGRPDLLMRRKSDGKAFVLPLIKNKRGYKTGRPINTGIDLSGARDALKVGDWDLDGRGDLIVRQRRDDRLWLYRGAGNGKFERPVVIERGMRRVRRLGAVGDFNGDGRPDLVGQPAGSNATVLYPGRAMRGVGHAQRIYSAMKLNPVGVGRWNFGGAPDVIYHTRDKLFAMMGNGPGGYLRRTTLDVDYSKYSEIAAVHNLGGGRHVDLIMRERGTGALLFFPAFYRGGKVSSDPIRLGRRVRGFDMIT